MDMTAGAEENPLADRRVRALFGLVGGIIIASIGVIYFDGPVMWFLIAFGVFDALFTPYILGKAFEENTADGAQSA